MTDVITADEMRELEKAAMESGSVSGLELMERAGQGVVEAIFEEWPALTEGAHRAVILCGPGNNGGDGFVVARLLQARGWSVKTACVAPLAALKGDAATNAARVAAQDADLMPYNAESLQHAFEAPGSIVLLDALLGLGQTRNADDILEPFHHGWDAMANTSPDNQIYVVSVDMPTGYDTDEGALLANNPFDADLIVTFHCEKPVHRVLSAQGCKTVVKDIGL